jgi:DNA polymerase IV
MRKIIHVDADSFYASVEIRENPTLADKPVAVGGSPAGRGVIATCNYHARRFGIHSAMPSSQALRLCPQLVFTKPRFELYRSVSSQIHQIFHDYTEFIEPLSLDEAYLDVSNCEQCHGSATLIAEDIRRKVKEQIGVTVSAGVAPNKFLAKVASDWNKPDGIFVIKPEDIGEFIKALPVKKINGVGKVTAAKMLKLGIKNCEDLQQLNVSELSQHFGSWGTRLFELARGIDNREVSTQRIRKSLSTEHTYERDLTDLPAVIEKCQGIFDELNVRFTKISKDYRVTKRFVKVKFSDFSQTTLEESLSVTENWANLVSFTTLMEMAWRRQAKPVRLLGMGVRVTTLNDTCDAIQPDLFK